MTPAHARLSITVSARAKINLALAVGPARPGDGYHEIASWFAPLDLADEVTVSAPARDGPSTLDISWASDAPRPSPIDWPKEKDLAFRAHRALEAKQGRPLPAAVSLCKRIPTGGGLGGGSADAGATLLALREFFALPISLDELAAVALTLGSDVPYFVRRPGAAAIVEGLGERVGAAPDIRPSLALVLIFPPFGCPTGAVYKAFDSAPARPLQADRVREIAQRARPMDAELFNDLASPAERVAPPLAAMRARASEAAGLPAHITGSGSTMFMLCPKGEQQAARAAAAVSGALPDCVALRSRLA